MIFKFNNIKQAHTNTILSRKNYIVRFEMLGRIFLSKFRNRKIVNGSKYQTTKKNDVLEIALDQ